MNKMYENSYNQSFGGGYRSMTKASGRKYAVPNQWHGKYKDYIKVSVSFEQTPKMNSNKSPRVRYLNSFMIVDSIPWIPDLTPWIPDSAPWIPDSATWIPNLTPSTQDSILQIPDSSP